MNSNTNRILHWICTGEHTFEGDYKATAKSISLLSGYTTETSPGTASSYSTEGSSKEQNTEPASVELLVGCDDDILVPSTDDINCTFLKAQNIWRNYISRADLLPSGCLPADCLDPYLSIQDIPPLPQNLHKKQVITGRALWHVPSPELARSGRSPRLNGDEVWNPEHVHGPDKPFYLWTDKSTVCGISSRPNFRHWPIGEQRSDNSPNGLAIFTLYWSYILSARLLEMQKRPIQDVGPRANEIVIHLGHAPKELVRWLRAVLAQGSGWFVKGRLPPWTAHYEGSIRFIVSEAADLLVEFCKLYPFGSQPTAAFLAALMLPFHNEQGLQPQLPLPRIDRHPPLCPVALEPIRKLVHDLPYFMTLSACGRYIGSAIWSIFWEPGIQCNLASPWLGSICQEISPILEAGDTERLAKVFALRRPRLASLWLGLLLCGCPEVMDVIRSYLQTLEEKPYRSSFARPDADVALWTGSRQSFFDEEGSGPYLSQSSQVPRSDLLRHRFDFRLGDGAYILHFGWQPFGTVEKTEVEPELWPRLECEPQQRKYIHWVWWLSEDESVTELGLRHDTGKNDVNSVAEELGYANSTVAIPSGFHCSVALEPSKQATYRILDWGSTMASGERSIDAVAIPGVKHHPWLGDAREILGG